MKDTYILGIESSCDETSASIVKNGTEEIATVISSQIDIHKDFGGVVPEIASRNHVKNIGWVLDEALATANIKLEDIKIKIDVNYAVLQNILELTINKIEKGKVSCGEIGIPVKKNGIILPCGIYGRWEMTH
mgnify:CR=1 FL=1